MSHIRRKDREIHDTADIDGILRAGRFVVVALADGDEPYAVTLSYGYDAEKRRLCFHAATAGRKLDIIARNPLACATVVVDNGYKVGECAHPYRSVVMTGRMRALEEPDEARDAMRVLVDHLESEQASEEIWDRNGLTDDAAFTRITMLEFSIETLCAKQGE